MNIAFPHPPGFGGPGSFQNEFEKYLISQGFTISYRDQRKIPDLIFVVGGTKQIGWLSRMELKGIPIIYRLDGIKWLHRFQKRQIQKFLFEEFRNQTSKLIHSFLADHIVYQSQFSKEWWEKEGWRKKENFDIIYNGVDLSHFKKSEHSTHPTKLVILEGNIDYSPFAIPLINQLRELIPKDLNIEVYGNFTNQHLKEHLHPSINYKGFIYRDQIPEVFQNAIYFSLDVNPACPNTVIEAMACGAPVVGYDTGALKELVSNEAGKVVSYGSDPWKLECPDAESLVVAIEEIRN